jgi:predicted RNase H-like HicB family nuclease
MKEKYLIVLEKTASGYSAYSPDVLGCISTGENIENTIQNMKEALIFHLESILNDNEPIPQPQGVQSYLEAIEMSEGEDFFLTHLAIEIPTLQKI